MKKLQFSIFNHSSTLRLPRPFSLIQGRLERRGVERRAKPRGNFQFSKGFTIVELLVSIAILGIMFSMVLANFRAGQKSGQLDIVLKQVISGITNVRNMSLGGQTMADGSFPSGGYGIHFEPTQFWAFAKTAASNPTLPNTATKFDQVSFIQFCGLNSFGITQDNITNLPCQSGWESFDSPLEIIFSLPSEISAVPAADLSGKNFKYVGGVIRHAKSGQQAYFYVSLISGLVSGDTMP